jgi:hypothetical protein
MSALIYKVQTNQYNGPYDTHIRQLCTGLGYIVILKVLCRNLCYCLLRALSITARSGHSMVLL